MVSHYSYNKNPNPNLCRQLISSALSFVTFIHCTLVILAFFQFLKFTKILYASRRLHRQPLCLEHSS